MSDTTKRIGQAAVVVSVGVLLSRLLGFARGVVLADQLGDTRVADAYEAAFIIPDFLTYLLAGGFLAITFMPILSRYLADGDTDGANRAFNIVIRPVFVVIVALTVIGFFAARWIIELAFGAGFDAEQLAEVTRLTRLILPAQIFFVLGGLFTAVQYAHGKFVIPTLAPIVYNAGIIIGGVIGNLGGEPTATGFIVGALVGAFVGNFALQWWGASRCGIRLELGGVSFSSPVFREYLVLAIPLTVGQSIVVLDESFGKVIAALAEDGAVFSLNLARRVNMVPIGMIAQAAGVAAYPFFARLVAEGRLSEMRVSIGETIRIVIYVSGLAAAVILAVSQPAIRVAFQHGRFSQSGTILTAAALVGYAASIPAWGVHQIFARGFYAHRQMWVPVIAGTAWTIIAIPLFLIGFDQWGIPGVAVASSVAISGYAITLAIQWRRRHTGEGLDGTIATLVRSTVGATVAAASGWAVANGITGGQIPPFGQGIGAMLAGGATAAFAYGVVTRALGSVEARQLIRR